METVKVIFTTARTRKQPRWPSTEECTKMWYIYTMEYDSVMKRNETGSFVVMRMNLQSVAQNKVSQREKSKHGINLEAWYR